MDNNQKNKKGFFSISKGLIFILLGIIFVFVLIYVLRFHRVLSSEHLTWSQFGDIFNGVISPIFAGINICIFWYLTKVVDLNNDERQDEMLKNEKTLLLMQFRKTEVDRLDEALYNVIANNNNFNKLVDRVFNAYIIASYFYETKSAFFDIKDDSDLAKDLKSLIDDLDELSEVLESGPKAETTISKKERDKVIDRTIDNIVELKANIISSLLKITLNQNKPVTSF